MIFPRFSIRALFGITLIAAVLSLAIAAAVRGQPWGVAVTLVLISLGVLFGIYAAFFAAGFAIHQITDWLWPQRLGESPFGKGGPGPRYVEPSDPQ